MSILPIVFCESKTQISNKAGGACCIPSRSWSRSNIATTTVGVTISKLHGDDNVRHKRTQNLQKKLFICPISYMCIDFKIFSSISSDVLNLFEIHVFEWRWLSFGMKAQSVFFREERGWVLMWLKIKLTWRILSSQGTSLQHWHPQD